MAKNVSIGDRWVGEREPCFIIAEAGVNHNGDVGLAKQLVNAAVAAGADAVKFQTYKTENVVLKTAPKAKYQKNTTDAAESQYQMLKKLELTEQDFVQLMDYCKQQGILFMSTPHDQESMDVLDELGISVFKVGSGDITNIPYLEHMALKGKPIILSTGMSALGEAEEAVDTILSAANRDLILLHCVSNYPARAEDCNLRAMRTLEIAFNLPVGFSDHTLGIEIPMAAVAMGAKVIEKHFTLDKDMPGPDHKASLQPDELKAMVQGIRKIESALGDGAKKPVPDELDTLAVARKSIVAKVDIAEGEVIRESHLAIKRPGTGIKPKYLDYIVGKKANRNIEVDTLLSWEDIE
jgi:N,N'-diacetyllegionaminate synthase